MYPIPLWEHLVETKTCRHCGESFPITDKDMEFYKKVSPTFGGKKYLIPPPALCPDCRQQRRLAFRNERKLYKKISSKSNKEIVTQFSPDKDIHVLSMSEYYSNSWIPSSLSIDWDTRMMLQFDFLNKKCPKISLLSDIISEENNSQYQNWSSRNKNCYLIFCAGDNYDCAYGYSVDYSTDCIDNTWLRDCEWCFESIDCNNCYACFYVQNSSFCKNIRYCYDCINCSFCWGCVGLRNKEYYILNKAYSKKDYFEELIKLWKEWNLPEFLDTYKKLRLRYPRRFATIDSSINSTGEFIYDSSNIKASIKVYESQNCAYSSKIVKCTDCYDLDSWWDSWQLIYECITVWKNAFNCIFSNNCWPSCSNLMYCDSCIACSYCILCTGLKNKSYCILNRQYTKEEYELLVPKIIEHMTRTGEWWEFFPSSLSPFGYNETVAQEYFPLSKSEAIKDKVFNWSDYEAPFPKVEKIIPASKLPEDISKIPDDILNWAIECEVTGKPFRIIRQELEFYRKHNLPIPRRHPDQRHLDRMKQRNPRKLFERKCDKCQKDMITTYAPERLEIVYCEECYNREVIG